MMVCRHNKMVRLVHMHAEGLIGGWSRSKQVVHKLLLLEILPHAWGGKVLSCSVPGEEIEYRAPCLGRKGIILFHVWGGKVVYCPAWGGTQYTPSCVVRDANKWRIMGRIAGGIGRHGRIMCDCELFATYTLLEAIIIVPCSPMINVFFYPNVWAKIVS